MTNATTPMFGSMEVPATDAATADLEQAWAQFNWTLAAIRPSITQEQADALDNAALAIEETTRTLAVAHQLQVAAAVLHREVSEFRLPPR